jgi:NADH-quinone oxidoreductase subunit N
MTSSPFISFLPELVLLSGALVAFLATLGESRARQAREVALMTSVAAIIACVFCLGQNATLFSGAYRVDQFSQILKLVFACGFTLILLLSGNLPDIREEVKPEYYLFLTLSVTGLVMLVSCVDIITLVVALEVSAFPLYFLVADAPRARGAEDPDGVGDQVHHVRRRRQRPDVLRHELPLRPDRARPRCPICCPGSSR